jgi:hypothetical protein
MNPRWSVSCVADTHPELCSNLCHALVDQKVWLLWISQVLVSLVLPCIVQLLQRLLLLLLLQAGQLCLRKVHLLVQRTQLRLPWQCPSK